MNRRAFGLGAAATLSVAGCGNASNKFKSYHGPEVTSVVINKGARKMYLLHNEEVLREYKVDLGFAPSGAKTIEGDGKTPEGTYVIDRRNPNSSYHLSVGISYPNSQDVAEANALGKRPGGEIFIHGQPNDAKARRRAARVDDWTAGCIAVSNDEIEEIYSMVGNGTTITLRL
ncbi:L,D-transpeptidase family protein [Parasedimentitalea huanghaiensis]|uniref:L,D-transpeptidase family protein n=1 Tax=Parasedimentitalea huanghaiensis TaxID=2682100 RepID=A0A6L6WK36_9RHOB|nr:L,D-transpeptidase family protein [Zongyanglinia huanghaiensis]MVO17790.1 L,D-transpeptidase family protein [Zongyanglinia huanghaiensis]